MKFAHMADCHIGSWRDPKLRDAALKAFSKATDICIEKEADFILISGDLFNTSLPAIDQLKKTVLKLKQLKDKNIAVYIVPGSHDFSPSGKTILDVLENAGLLINVVKGSVEDGKLRLKFTVDIKTGAKIAGMLGKKGALERKFYFDLIKKNLEEEKGYKIFMFHSALTEFKPEELDKMQSHPLSLLPKNFDYYAGGHVHYVFEKREEDYGLIVYPGPLFPNSFRELEKLERGGFYIVEDNELEFMPLQIYNVCKIEIDCNHKSPEEIEAEVLQEIKNKEFNNTIVTIRLTGTLKSGKPSDINFKEIFSILYNKSAYFVMKSTSKLTTKEFEEIKIEQGPVKDVEEKLIREHLGQILVKGMDVKKEEKLTKELIKVLSKEREEGERVVDFEKRVKEDVENVLKVI